MTTLKYEAVYVGDYETFEHVVQRLPQFIDHVYNADRLRSRPPIAGPGRVRIMYRLGISPSL
jgi:hypothetical protein